MDNATNIINKLQERIKRWFCILFFIFKSRHKNQSYIQNKLNDIAQRKVISECVRNFYLKSILLFWLYESLVNYLNSFNNQSQRYQAEDLLYASEHKHEGQV